MKTGESKDMYERRSITWGRSGSAVPLELSFPAARFDLRDVVVGTGDFPGVVVSLGSGWRPTGDLPCP